MATTSGLLSASVAGALDAQSILETRRQKEIARWRGVQSYAVAQTSDTGVEKVGGQPVPLVSTWLFYEKLQVASNRGFRLVSPHEIIDRLDGFSGESMRVNRSEALKAIGQIGMFIPGAAGGVGSALADHLTYTTDWFREEQFSADEDRMIDRIDDSEYEGMRAFARSARLLGTINEDDGSESFMLYADGLERRERTYSDSLDAPLTSTVETITLHLDTQTYVPRYLRIEGHAVADRQERRKFVVERLDSDYRTVDTLLYPFRTVTKFSLSATAADRAKLKEKQKELAEFAAKKEELERQLAKLPAGQAQLIRTKLEAQLAKAEKLAAIEEGEWSFQATHHVSLVVTGWAEDLTKLIRHLPWAPKMRD